VTSKRKIVFNDINNFVIYFYIVAFYYIYIVSKLTNIISTLYVILLLLNDLLSFNTGDDEITIVSNANIAKFLDRSENIRRY